MEAGVSIEQADTARIVKVQDPREIFEVLFTLRGRCSCSYTIFCI